MKKILLLLFIKLSLSQSVFSQQITIIIDGQQGDRPLTFEDFKGKPDKQNPRDAETTASVRCDYTHLQIKGDSITVGDAVVQVEMMPYKSWKKRMNDALLKHEQGHFDMKKIWGMALKKAFDGLTVPRIGYPYYFSVLADSINKKYQAMDVQYDKETNHGIISAAQEKWNQFFKDNPLTQ